MIDRVLLDAAKQPLLNLWRVNAAEVLYVAAEGLPDILPVGEIRELAGTGVKVYVGADQLRAGSYTLELGTHGRTHADAFNLQRALIQAANLTRFVQRNGAILPVVRFKSISRTFRGSPQLAGRVKIEFEPVTPYWLTDHRAVNAVVGTQVVQVGGMARVHLKVTFAGAVTNPSITTDAGVTTWLGTVPAGQQLVIDASPGVWSVTLNGNSSAALKLSGPQPYLEPGSRSVTASHPATLEWQEGEL